MKTVKYFLIMCLLMGGYDVSVADMGTKKTACFVNLLRKLMSPTKKMVRSFIRPIKDPKLVKFQDVLDTNKKIKATLEDLGVGFIKINRKNRLSLNLQRGVTTLDVPPWNVVDDIGFDVSPYGGRVSEIDIIAEMGVFKITKLPEASTKTDYFVNAFKHPEMKSYMERLKKMGYDLVIDPTINHTGVGGYHRAHPGMIGLTPNSSWGIFKHEFQHAKFESFLMEDFFYKQTDVLSGKKLEKILSREVVEKLGGVKKVRRIESLLKKELPSRATNETLSVATELELLGFKKFVSFSSATRALDVKNYALKHQINELNKLGKFRNLTLRRKRELVRAVTESMLIESIGPVMIAGSIGVGAYVLFYSERLKMIIFKNKDQDKFTVVSQDIISEDVDKDE